MRQRRAQPRGALMDYCTRYVQGSDLGVVWLYCSGVAFGMLAAGWVLHMTCVSGHPVAGTGTGSFGTGTVLVSGLSGLR